MLWDMLDQIDRKLLELLQSDASLTNAQLAERINTSVSQAGRRKLRLEQEGFITASRAQLDPERLGLSIEAFIELSLNWHDADLVEPLHTVLRDQPEIVEVWALTGQADYLLRVYCRDLKQLNRLVHDVLLRHKVVAKVESKIVMNQVKSGGALPIPR